MKNSTTTIGRLPKIALCIVQLFLGAVLPAVALSLTSSAIAQELDGLDGDAQAIVDPFVTESGPTDILPGEPADNSAFLTESGFPEEGAPAVRPVNWISGPYLRGGVNFVMSKDLFDAEQGTGYGISGGWRQPLGPEIGGDRFFFDLGGSFQNAYGRSSTKGTPGRRVTTIANIVIEDAVVPNLYVNTLEEVRRGSAHAALGWFWGSGLDNRTWDPQLRIASRIGGRVGHARGSFTEEQIVFPNANQTIVPASPDTDTYGGLFVGTEAILLQRQFSLGHFQWTVDGEFANDWIDFGGRWEGSLGTASVMMGFMLSR